MFTNESSLKIKISIDYFLTSLPSWKSTSTWIDSRWNAAKMLLWFKKSLFPDLFKAHVRFRENVAYDWICLNQAQFFRFALRIFPAKSASPTSTLNRTTSELSRLLNSCRLTPSVAGFMSLSRQQLLTVPLWIGKVKCAFYVWVFQALYYNRQFKACEKSHKGWAFQNILKEAKYDTMPNRKIAVYRRFKNSPSGEGPNLTCQVLPTRIPRSAVIHLPLKHPWMSSSLA